MDRDASSDDAPAGPASPTSSGSPGGSSDGGSTDSSAQDGARADSGPASPTTPMAVRVMGDRVLCAVPSEEDRRSKSGIIIPATAKTADRRGLWATAEEVGPLARSIERGDRVLFLPDAAIEVDVRGEVYLIVRERDVHAVASGERDVSPTGLYL